MLEIQNYNLLSALKNHEDGEVAFCTDEQKYYMYNNGEWVEVKAQMEGDGLKLNLYDLNKQIVSQLPDFTDEKIEELKSAIKIWKSTHVDNKYLLYGKEIGYFTLFESGDCNGDEEALPFEEEIMACLKYTFTAIKEYDVEGSSIEIWVSYKPEGSNDIETIVLYLFGYDMGVIKYNG